MTTELSAGRKGTSPTTNLKERFRALAHLTAEGTGSAAAFLVALLMVIVWLITGSY